MDFVDSIPLIGSVGDLVTGAFTNYTNKKIADQNLAFERENLEYQKELQNKIFDREDTAYQRTVNDMRSAGINPLTMKGTNGAGQAIQTTAPQNKHVADPVSFNNAMNTISSLSSVITDNEQKKAQTNLINAQKDEQEVNNKFVKAQRLLEISKMIAEIENSRSDTDGKKLTNEYQKKVNKNYDDYALQELNRLRAEINSINADTNVKKLQYDNDYQSFIDNKNFWASVGLPSGLDYETKMLFLDILGSGAGTILLADPGQIDEDKFSDLQAHNFGIMHNYARGKKFKEYMQFLSGALKK